MKLKLVSSKCRFAFTLAEVLITLGIIGVVAALTIPNLIQANEKRTTVAKLQKAISIINQAYALSYDDNGDVTKEQALTLGAKEYFDKYWAPYIKTATLCTSYTTCGYTSNYPFVGTNGRTTTDSLIYSDYRIPFQTHDGFVYNVYVAYGGSTVEFGASRLILVDINGREKPNKMGRDVFWLERIEDVGGRVQARGHELSDEELNNDCSKNGSGERCAEKIRRAGWKIEKDYPW